MGQEGLNASDTEMVLANKKGVEFVRKKCREVFDEADRFMSDEANRHNERRLNSLLKEMDVRETNMNTLYLVGLATYEEWQDYRFEKIDCCGILTGWFYER